jgi:hypothetical protein
MPLNKEIRELVRAIRRNGTSETKVLGIGREKIYGRVKNRTRMARGYRDSG